MALIDDTQDMVLVHRVFSEAFQNADQYAVQDKFDVATRYYSAVLNFLTLHHGAEDLILWPRLLERSPDNANIVETNISQHKAVHTALDDLSTKLSEWISNRDEESAKAFRVAVNSAEGPVTDHLVHEQEVILPICEAYIEEEEWYQLPGHTLRALDGADLMMTLGLVMEQFKGSKFFEMMNENLPPPLKDAYYDQGEPMFIATMSELRA